MKSLRPLRVDRSPAVPTAHGVVHPLLVDPTSEQRGLTARSPHRQAQPGPRGVGPHEEGGDGTPFTEETSTSLGLPELQAHVSSSARIHIRAVVILLSRAIPMLSVTLNGHHFHKAL